MKYKYLSWLFSLREAGYFNRWVIRSFLLVLTAWFLYLVYLNGGVSGGGYYTCPEYAAWGSCDLEFYDPPCTRENPMCKPRIVSMLPGETYGNVPHPLTQYQTIVAAGLFLVFAVINDAVWRIKRW